MIKFTQILGIALLLLVTILLFIKLRRHVKESNEEEEYEVYNQYKLENIEPTSYNISIFGSNYNLIAKFTIKALACLIDTNPLLHYIDEVKKNHLIYIKENFIVKIDEL